MFSFRCFTYVVLVGCTLIASNLIYMHTTLYSRKGFGKELLAVYEKGSKADSLGVIRKQFVYLVQTEQCLPSHLAESIDVAQNCNCDIIVLSFQAKCNKSIIPSHTSYIFYPQTTWGSGRNVLYFTALNRRLPYRYYIFLDDDVTFSFNKMTPPDLRKTQPLRVVQDWLLEYEPVLGVLDYAVHHGAEWTLQRRRQLCGIHDTSLVMPVVWFDALFHAFHRKAVAHILPYNNKYEKESWWVSALHIMAVLGLKFRGQALLFAAVTVGNPKHREYPRSTEHFNARWRSFIEEIQREAPTAYRNCIIFEEHKENLAQYTLKSSTYCINVTRHHPVVPYAYLDRERLKHKAILD